MRTTGWKGWSARTLLTLALLAGGARGARGCWECDGIACVPGEGGARACFLGVHGCVAFGSCGGGPGPMFDGGAALQLTWIEGGDPAAGPRVLHGAGRRVFGASALRVLRAAAGEGAAPSAVAAAIAGLGEAFDVALTGADGEGVALEWTADGRGGRVNVRALRTGVAGAALADERLAEHDVLIVPVVHGGRDYVLLVQPRLVPRLAPRLESEDLARTVRDAVRPGRERLELSVTARP